MFNFEQFDKSKYLFVSLIYIYTYITYIYKWLGQKF